MPRKFDEFKLNLKETTLSMSGEMIKYRLCFLLTTAAGNKTRFANLRRFADQEADLDITWVPLSGYPPYEIAQKLRFLPTVWLSRFWTARLLAPVLLKLRSFDAVIVHQFEAETLLTLAGYVSKVPIVISSTDDAPVVDESTYPLYDFQTIRSSERRKLRLKLDLWRTRRMDYFIPFTRWAANILEQGCGVPPNRILPLHVGLDLSFWVRPALPIPRTTERFKILFVGGEFLRKGGDLLLKVFQEYFSEVAELHVVSSQAPALQFDHVFLHTGLQPNSRQLIDLYAGSDVLAMPTTADLIPWTFLEAMAMELPCIGTNVGAIDEVIEDGITGFLIPPRNEAALRTAISTLLDDSGLCRRMGRLGREKVEAEFDSAKNVPRMMATIRSLVDARRATKAR